LAALAHEVAMDIEGLPAILDTYKLTQTEYDALLANETFTRILDAARVEWEAASNTLGRVKIKSAAMFEQVMPHLYARMVDRKENLNHVTETAKLVAKAAGIGEDAGRNGAPGEKFQIIINLGADTMNIEQSKAPIPPLTIDGQVVDTDLDAERI
jgi:hypothetical protein